MSVPGIQNVWIARKANATVFTYLGDEFGIIEWIKNSAGNPTPFHEFECDLDFDEASQELQAGVNGRLLPVSVQLRFANMQQEKRSVLEALIHDKVVIAYLDNNLKYWLVGQENGLMCSNYLGSSAINGYTLTFEGTERNLVREVNGTNFIYTSPNGGQGSGASTARITNLGGSGPNGGITAVLNTWFAPDGTPMPLSQLGAVPLNQIIQ